MKNALIAVLLSAVLSSTAGAATALDAGLRLMNEKKYPQAVAAFEKEAAANPGSPQVLLNLGWAYWHAKRVDDAWKVGSTLVKLDPENPTFLVFLANTALERKEYAEAQGLARKALRLSPEDRGAALVLARAEFLGGDKAKGARTLDDLIARNPGDADARYRRAMFAAEMGGKRAALETLESLLRADPSNPTYRRSRAKLLADVGREDEARSEWEGISRKDPDAQALMNLGWAYWREGRMDDAHRIAELLLKLDDKNPAFLRLMANLEIEKMHYPEAERLARRALEAQPGDRDASLTLARALLRLQKEKEASAILRRLVEKYPDHQGVQYQWAEYLARTGEAGEAISFFDRLIKADPANDKYRLERAAALYETERYAEAIEEWRRLAARTDTRDEALKRLRDDAFNRRAWSEAAEWQDKMIDVDPGDPARWERLARIELADRRYEEALRAADKALAADPQWITAGYLRAEVLEQLERWREAQAAYEDISVRNPNSFRALDGLSRVLEAQRDYAGALRALRRVARMIEPSVSLHLQVREARLLAAAGRAQDARRVLTRLTARRAPAIPALLYHGVSLHDRGDTISQARLREQLSELKARGYTTITVSEYDRVLKGEAELPEKPLLLTFDDGRTDSFENADPVLKELGLRATMFVHLSRLRKPHFHAGPDEIRRWQQTGRWEMQSHGESAHDPMTIDERGRLGHFLPNRMWLPEKNRLETLSEYRERVETDYKHAREGVEAITGRQVVAFAYPYGDYGQNDYTNTARSAAINRELVRKYFHLAFVQEQFGVNALTSNPTDLRRYEVPKHMSGRELADRVAGSDPWVQARVLEADLWTQAGQLGQARAIYKELEDQGLSGAVIWAGQGSVLQRAGEFSGARRLYEQAHEQEAGGFGPRGVAYERHAEQSRLAAEPKVTAEGQRFTDSNTNEIWKAFGRVEASVKTARVEAWGGPGEYKDRVPPDAPAEKIRSREGGAAVRWYLLPALELDGQYARREFRGGASWGSDNYLASAAVQALRWLTLRGRTGMGNVETANAIRAERVFRTEGGGVTLDPALNWTLTGDFDRIRYNDGNREKDWRAQAMRRIDERVSLGAAYFRGDSTRPSGEYYTPRRLDQYTGILRLEDAFGQPSLRTASRPVQGLVQYEAGYGTQPGGDRVVHSVLGQLRFVLAERVSLTLRGRYSQSPTYISREADAGLGVSF